MAWQKFNRESGSMIFFFFSCNTCIIVFWLFNSICYLICHSLYESSLLGNGLTMFSNHFMWNFGDLSKECKESNASSKDHGGQNDPLSIHITVSNTLLCPAKYCVHTYEILIYSPFIWQCAIVISCCSWEAPQVWLMTENFPEFN